MRRLGIQYRIEISGNGQPSRENWMAVSNKLVTLAYLSTKSEMDKLREGYFDMSKYIVVMAFRDRIEPEGFRDWAYLICLDKLSRN